ncbi:hypothetical protein D3C78_831870 [compost metagenome]
MLELLDLVHDELRFFIVGVDVQTELLGFGDDVALSGKLGDQNTLLIPDKLRLNMLVGFGVLHNGGYMNATFVSEGCIAHICLTNRHMHICDFAYVTGCSRQTGELVLRQHVIVKLDLQVRNDRAEVGIAAAFSIAVNGALYLTGAGLNGCQGVCYGQLAVIMRMNTDRSTKLVINSRHDFMNFSGHRAAVRIAEHEPVRSSLLGFFQYGQSIFRVVLVAVEEMLSIK